MKVLDIQLFVLLHAKSIQIKETHFTPHAAFIGKRNVSSSVKTLRRRKWLKYKVNPYMQPMHKGEQIFETTNLGNFVLWNSLYEAQEG